MIFVTVMQRHWNMTIYFLRMGWLPTRRESLLETRLLLHLSRLSSLCLLSIFIAASDCLIVLDVGTWCCVCTNGYVGGAEFESPSWWGKAEGIKPLNISSFYVINSAFASYISYKSPFLYGKISIYSFQIYANSHLLWRIMITSPYLLGKYSSWKLGNVSDLTGMIDLVHAYRSSSTFPCTTLLTLISLSKG